MSRASRFHALLRSRAWVLLMLLPAVLLSTGCDDDDVIGNTSPYTLRVSLSADFQVPHGDQPVNWALIRAADVVTLATGDGTVSATTNPAFTLRAGAVLEFGVDYELRYWIDSNTGGGTAGVCDHVAIDHQWNFKFRAPDNDVNLILVYDVDRVEDVCATFN
ncbi:MAG: hypothetical protein OEV00_16230 [Acidobacteriota bacterium]|nr:hypothetical protein [Acidobacteriota bacterium]MDH3786860.1 hypothetical protein [Acidobacteriota bacterium]